MHHKRKRRSLGIRTRRLLRILANRSWIEPLKQRAVMRLRVRAIGERLVAVGLAAANGLEARPPADRRGTLWRLVRFNVWRTGRKDGKPVAVRIWIDFEFKLAA
jgi:hypothetical protein